MNRIMVIHYPIVYYFQYLMKLCKNLKGGLQEVADQLELRRVGPQHQAGSDSHLTGMAFFKIKEVCLPFYYLENPFVLLNIRLRFYKLKRFLYLFISTNTSLKIRQDNGSILIQAGHTVLFKFYL